MFPKTHSSMFPSQRGTAPLTALKSSEGSSHVDKSAEEAATEAEERGWSRHTALLSKNDPFHLSFTDSLLRVHLNGALSTASNTVKMETLSYVVTVGTK